MNYINLQQLPIDLDDGLRLRWATPADNDQLVELAFHALDEDDEEYPFVKIFVQDRVDGKFPILRHEDMTVVEDTNTGKIVSSMCLFSETWRYCETPIKVGQPVEVVQSLVMKNFESKTLKRTFPSIVFGVLHGQEGTPPSQGAPPSTVDEASPP